MVKPLPDPGPGRKRALIVYIVGGVLLLGLFVRGEIRDDHIAELQRKNVALTDEVRALQQKTSDEVLCPLYGALVDQIKALTPKQKADSNVHEQIVVIRQGYKALSCKPPPVEPVKP